MRVDRRTRARTVRRAPMYSRTQAAIAQEVGENAGGGDGDGGIGGGTGTPSNPGSPPVNYLAVVEQARADLVAASVSLAGVCGAFELVKVVANRLHATDPTVGLLLKPGGTNCTGYAADIVNFKGGRLVDVAFDQNPGSDVTAVWNVKNEVRPVEQWHAPIPGAIP